MTATLLVGIPGSGKTTYALRQMEDDPDAVRIERDEIRRMLGCFPMGTHAQEKMVTQVQRGMIETAIKDGLHPIVSDTNVNPQTRENLIRFIHRHGSDVNVVLLDVDLDECLRRNAARPEPVPEHVIRKMHSKLSSQIANGKLTTGLIEYPKFQPYLPADDKDSVFIVDIDGTVAEGGDVRSYYDYSKVNLDRPKPEVIAVVQALIAKGYTVMFVTGRPDSCKRDTRNWLKDHITQPDPPRVFMRKSGDGRPDYVVKNEIYDNDILPLWNIAAVFEDREQIVTHLRKRGITVLQVADGRY